MRGVVVGLFAAIVAANAFAEEAPTPFTTAEITSAVGGEVLIQAERGDLNRGQVIGLVQAPIALVSEIIRDTGTHERWFPDMVESDRVSSTLHSGRTHLPLLRDRYWRLNGVHERVTHGGMTCEVMRYSYDHSYERGNMEELHGYWLICPQGETTVVKYVINADLGVWLPGAVVSWAQRKMLPGIIEGLNAEADRRR